MKREPIGKQLDCVLEDDLAVILESSLVWPNQFSEMHEAVKAHSEYDKEEVIMLPSGEGCVLQHSKLGVAEQLFADNGPATKLVASIQGSGNSGVAPTYVPEHVDRRVLAD